MVQKKVTTKPNTKTPISKTKSNKKLVRYPSYQVREKIGKETKELYYQLITHKLGFNFCGKYRWTRRDLREVQSAIDNCKFENSITIQNLGVYKAILTNFIVTRDNEKRFQYASEVQVTRYDSTENGITEFVYAPVYNMSWGDNLYELVGSIVNDLGSGILDIAYSDYMQTPESERGEDVSLEEYEKSNN